MLHAPDPWTGVRSQQHMSLSILSLSSHTHEGKHTHTHIQAHIQTHMHAKIVLCFDSYWKFPSKSQQVAAGWRREWCNCCTFQVVVVVVVRLGSDWVEVGAELIATWGLRKGREPGQWKASKHTLYTLKTRLLGPASLLLFQLLNALHNGRERYNYSHHNA